MDRSSNVSSDRASPQRPAPLALIGLLLAALAALGAAPLVMPTSYSWIEMGTSESAAQGVPGAWLARLGFVLFGLAVLGVTVLRHRAWQPLATGLHGAFGVSMILVAAYSHEPWEPGASYVSVEATLHSVFASVMGFAFIGALATMLVVRRPRTVPAVAGDIAALAIAAMIPLFMSSPTWGVLQRLMFVTAAAWYGTEAWRSRDRPDLTVSSNQTEVTSATVATLNPRSATRTELAWWRRRNRRRD